MEGDGRKTGRKEGRKWSKEGQENEGDENKDGKRKVLAGRGERFA